MRKIYLLSILLLSGFFASAQVSLNGANIYLSSGSIFYVTDTVTLNNQANVDNNGSFDAWGLNVVNGTFTNSTTGVTAIRDSVRIADTLINNGDFEGTRFMVPGTGVVVNNQTLRLNKGMRLYNGSSQLHTSTGEFIFQGPNDNKRLDFDALAQLDIRKIVFNSDNPTHNIILESSVHVSDTAEFTSGIVRYDNPLNDSLVIDLTGEVVVSDSTSENSYIDDALYKYPGSVGEFMRFPVGQAGVGYRPLWILGANFSGGPSPLIAVEYQGTRTLTATQTVGYNPTYTANSWSFLSGPEFDSSIVQLQFASGEATLTESIVAEGFEVIAGDTIFFNLGQGATATVGTNGVVQSFIPAQGGNSTLMVGQSNELKLRLRFLLEGALPDLLSFVMDVDMTDTLASRYEFGGISTKPMLINKNVPATAVDSVKLYLRSGAAGSIVDSTSVWVMDDGSIRDYITGELPYAVFTNATAGSYFVIIQHRNHLRVQSTTSIALNNVDPGAGATYDFTDLSNIRGGGGVKMVGGGFVALAAGNSNEDNEVNAIDYYQVGVSQDASEMGYRNTDVLFNSSNSNDVDVNDFMKVQENSNVVYFSTVP